MILDPVLWLGRGRKDDSVGDSESFGEGHCSLKAKGRKESSRDQSLALRLAWPGSGWWIPASAWAGGLALPWVGRAKPARKMASHPIRSSQGGWKKEKSNKGHVKEASDHRKQQL